MTAPRASSPEMPAAPTMTPIEQVAFEEFSEYFRRNYPADTIISVPDWHIPKLWRTATWRLRAEFSQLRASSPSGEDTKRLRDELQEMMRRAQRVLWIDEQVKLGRGNVEFCVTEEGRVGVFARGNPNCRGIGLTVGEAIDNAIQRDKPIAARASSGSDAADSRTPEQTDG